MLTRRLRTPNRALLEPILRDLERLWEMRYWILDPTNPINPIEFKKSKDVWVRLTFYLNPLLSEESFPIPYIYFG